MAMGLIVPNDNACACLLTPVLFDAPAQPDNNYRYTLRKIWNPCAPTVLFVMLNPSTATPAQDDPTSRRCRGFASRVGAGGMVLVNLYAWRATKPAGLRSAVDPIGPDNDHAITSAAAETIGTQGRIIAAWGTHPATQGRSPAVLELLAPTPLWCLGITKSGAPRHPLFVPNSRPLIPYIPRHQENIVPAERASPTTPAPIRPRAPRAPNLWQQTCGLCHGGDHTHHQTDLGDICVGCDCEWTPAVGPSMPIDLGSQAAISRPSSSAAV